MSLFRVFACFIALLFCVCFITQKTYADTLFVVVSDRSVPDVVGGAHAYLDDNAHDKILIRSVSQVSRMTNEELNPLINTADYVLFLGVFGDVVERLLHVPYTTPSQYRWVLHSDKRLYAVQKGEKSEGMDEAKESELNNALNSSANTCKKNSVENFNQCLKIQQNNYPEFADWLQIKAYWMKRSTTNITRLFQYILAKPENAAPVEAYADTRIYRHSNSFDKLPASLQNNSSPWLKDFSELSENAITNLEKPTVFLLDHDSNTGSDDLALHKAICDEIIQQTDSQCISVWAAWGQASVDAVNNIQTYFNSTHNSSDNNSVLNARHVTKKGAIISLQDFVIGGGDGRAQVTELFKQSNVPVFNAIRLTEWQHAVWQLSAEGLPAESVHYRIAMPELQGLGQTHTVATISAGKSDTLTGVTLSVLVPENKEIQRLAKGVAGWMNLQEKNNADKKVAIIYYNHPPGRHNIGADNLNVPESLLSVLNAMKKAGYTTGDLPDNSQELLCILQRQGVNVPDNREALKTLSGYVAHVSAAQYQSWFQTFPPEVQAELTHGPLAALLAIVQQQQKNIHELPEHERNQIIQHLSALAETSTQNIHHALDGLRHQGRERAIALNTQLTQAYKSYFLAEKQHETTNLKHIEKLTHALIAMDIEGIKGWGNAPGDVMRWQNGVLIPGIQFGNIFIGPQPPRGWEIHEELLHANMTFPPTHQYMAFYEYLKHTFHADAFIHLGRHSTYEFLPQKMVGLSATDYPSLLMGELPSIYPYIVDGVGEGIQAKRRGNAIMIDHLTPPLAITPLYDDLLALRQLIESAEAATDEITRSVAITTLRKKIDELHLRDALEASMDDELTVRGVGFEQIDDSFLLHEVGHYLTHVQETFMPMGLHTFGKAWQENAINTMLKSMQNKNAKDKTVSKKNTANKKSRELLTQSPQLEMQSLLNALNGGFVAPGKGNDPIKTASALPTGRNFYALDGSLLPTPLAYDIGESLVARALKNHTLNRGDNLNTHAKNKQGIILWASDAVRDEGAMIAFGMAMLGVKPVWNSRGIIKKLERLPLSETHLPARQDVVFTTSGLFRDLYREHLNLLDKASLLALEASASTIKKEYPALIIPLNSALSPLGGWRTNDEAATSEPLNKNIVAANWVKEARKTLNEHPDVSPEILGRNASLRIFGSAPGAYGAGINRLVERSGAWQARQELGNTYIKRMGHAYGVGVSGNNAQTHLMQQLTAINHTYLGRASNLYGLIDNNDAFDYLGGFNLAIEVANKKILGETYVPESHVIHHADTHNIQFEPLTYALHKELHSRFFNPEWIKPLMKEGYAGARTMGSEFVEYLWGWQVTSPQALDNWVWEELNAVYVKDKYAIGVSRFLAEGDNRYVQTNILAVMLVAIQKGFWKADAETEKNLVEQFTQNIIAHGLPGSGHTHPYHPIYDWVKKRISVEKADALENVLAEARLNLNEFSAAENHQKKYTRIKEITLEHEDTQNPKKPKNEEQNLNPQKGQHQTLNTPDKNKAEENKTAKEDSAESKTSSFNLEIVIGFLSILIVVFLSGFYRSRKIK